MSEEFTGSRAGELTGLRFRTKEGHQACVSMLTHERPEAYVGGAGDETVLIRKADLEWLVDKLQTQRIGYDIVAVQSIADLPPEEAAQIRRRRGQPAKAEHTDRQKVLDDLRQRVQMP